MVVCKKEDKIWQIKNKKNYSQFCLVNIIPYKTTKEQGISELCNYRIYCGAPEYMNYDEPYAVEVCN